MEKAKRKKISEIIHLPEGIHAELGGERIKLKKGNDELISKIEYPVKIEGEKIIIECEKPRKKEKKMIKTTAAKIRNMVSGLNEKYKYKLQICAVHFPMNVAVHGNQIGIKNFLGEVKERKAKILPGVDVKIEKDIITIESHDKEKAGQTAANIETATKVRKRDRRIFQDGIYITEKQKGARRR